MHMSVGHVNASICRENFMRGMKTSKGGLKGGWLGGLNWGDDRDEGHSRHVSMTEEQATWLPS
jgi:hypothetical protein